MNVCSKSGGVFRGRSQYPKYSLIWILAVVVAMVCFMPYSAADKGKGKSNRVANGMNQLNRKFRRDAHFSRVERAAQPWDPPPGYERFNENQKNIFKPSAKASLDVTKFWGNGFNEKIRKELLQRHAEFRRTHDCSKRYGRNYCMPNNKEPQGTTASSSDSGTKEQRNPNNNESRHPIIPHPTSKNRKPAALAVSTSAGKPCATLLCPMDN